MIFCFGQSIFSKQFLTLENLFFYFLKIAQGRILIKSMMMHDLNIYLTSIIFHYFQKIFKYQIIFFLLIQSFYSIIIHHIYFHHFIFIYL